MAANVRASWNRTSKERRERDAADRGYATCSAKNVRPIVGRLSMVPGEDSHEALSRASAFPWARSVIGMPTLSRGWWVFRGGAE